MSVCAISIYENRGDIIFSHSPDKILIELNNTYMTIETKVPLPLNLSNENSHLFIPYSSYGLRPTSIKMLKNTFVTYSGLCINENGLIKECHHDYDYQLDEYLDDARHYYNLAKDDPANLIELDDHNLYLVIHHPWYNYYHWLCESISRLWMVRENVDKMVLLLPDSYQLSDFIMGSLEPFKLKDIRYIPHSKSLLVKNLCLPQIKPICDSYDKNQIHEIRNFYLSYVLQEKKIDIDLGDKLYLSRKKANRKHVENEDEIELIVKRYGFKVLCNEDFTFLEQIAIYSNAQYLVSIHGSGLTNMLFMQDNSTIFELHKSRTNDLEHPSFVFWYQAAALNFKYYHQVCDSSEGHDDYFYGDFKIDIPLFEQNIRLLLNQVT